MEHLNKQNKTGRLKAPKEGSPDGFQERKKTMKAQKLIRKHRQAIGNNWDNDFLVSIHGKAIRQIKKTEAWKNEMRRPEKDAFLNSYA